MASLHPLFRRLRRCAGGLVTGASNGAILGIPLFLGIAYTLLGYAVWEEAASLVDQPVKSVPG
jgi:hypothetical protein